MYCELSSTVTTITMVATWLPSVALFLYLEKLVDRRAKRKYPGLVTDVYKREQSKNVWTMAALLAALAFWGFLATMSRNLLC